MKEVLTQYICETDQKKKELFSPPALQDMYAVSQQKLWFPFPYSAQTQGHTQLAQGTGNFPSGPRLSTAGHRAPGSSSPGAGGGSLGLRPAALWSRGIRSPGPGALFPVPRQVPGGLCHSARGQGREPPAKRGEFPSSGECGINYDIGQDSVVTHQIHLWV